MKLKQCSKSEILFLYPFSRMELLLALENRVTGVHPSLRCETYGRVPFAQCHILPRIGSKRLET